MSYTDELRQMGRAMREYRREEPGVMDAFGALRRAAATDGALSAKHKELIALGIAAAMHCEGCILYHVRDALRAGATRAEILDAVGVAVLMGGGPGAVYGSKVVDMLAELGGETTGSTMGGQGGGQRPS